MINYITFKQLKEACKEHEYILLMLPSNHLMGVNCKVVSIIENQHEIDVDKASDFVGFIPCNFDQYISYKQLFISKKEQHEYKK